MIYEEGVVQMEINLCYGDLLMLVDQVFLFKWMICEVVLWYDMYVIFMFKLMLNQFGLVMYIYQFVVDKEIGENIFVGEDGQEIDVFLLFIVGYQVYLLQVIFILVLFVNFYCCFFKILILLVNVYWGYDNCIVGLWVFYFSLDVCCLENCIFGFDVNFYFVIVVFFVCGYFGIIKGLKLDVLCMDDCMEFVKFLFCGLLEVLVKFENFKDMIEVFGECFVVIYWVIKYEEFEIFMLVISLWEWEYFLFNV